MTTRSFFFTALCLLAFAVSVRTEGSAPSPAISDSLVEVLVTYQEFDPFLPWQKRRPGHRKGYGVAVGDGLVFTAEGLVRNQTLVELRRAGKGEKMAAAVVMADCRLGCALLRIDTSQSDPAPGLVPMEIAPGLPADASVEIVQFDETRRLQRGTGRVIQTAMKNLPSAPYSSLCFSVLTDLDINEEGAAVVHDGRLAGVLLHYDSQKRTGWMVPYSIMARFIQDARVEPYDGVASAGFTWKQLVDPAKRAYLGVTNGGHGILVLNCMPDSGASETLQPNDVILRWDGHRVDNLGFYEDPEYGRLSMPFLIMGRRKPGDMVPARILRDGKEMDVEVRLGRWSDADALIPENVAGRQPEYLVEGGMILLELTGKYLKAHGSNWQGRVDPRLTQLYLTKRLSPDNKGDRVVILTGVLPDTINVGYQGFRNAIVTAANRDAVKNMAEVFRIVDRDGRLERLSLQSIGVDLVLDEGQLEEANARLAEQYRLSSRRFKR